MMIAVLVAGLSGCGAANDRQSDIKVPATNAPTGDRQQRRDITALQKAEGVGHSANRHDMPTMAMRDSTVPYYTKKRTGKWRRERDSNPRYGN